MSNKHDSNKKAMRSKSQDEMHTRRQNLTQGQIHLDPEVGALAGDVQEDLVNLRHVGANAHKH